MRKAHDRHKVDIESILYTFYQMKVGQSIEKKSLYRLWDISNWVPLMSRYWFCMLQFFVKL